MGLGDPKSRRKKAATEARERDLVSLDDRKTEGMRRTNSRQKGDETTMTTEQLGPPKEDPL